MPALTAPTPAPSKSNARCWLAPAMPCSRAAKIRLALSLLTTSCTHLGHEGLHVGPRPLQLQEIEGLQLLLPPAVNPACSSEAIYDW